MPWQKSRNRSHSRLTLSYCDSSGLLLSIQSSRDGDVYEPFELMQNLRMESDLLHCQFRRMKKWVSGIQRTCMQTGQLDCVSGLRTLRVVWYGYKFPTLKTAPLNHQRLLCARYKFTFTFTLHLNAVYIIILNPTGNSTDVTRPSL